MVNEALVRQVMEHIAANPDTWDQDTYVGQNDCGTTYCFAGHALFLNGLDPWCGGVEQLAETLLGFTESQAARIFYYFPETEIEEDAGERIDYREHFPRRFELMCKRVSDVTGVNCMDLAYQVKE